jgi:hypothetical protein
MIKLTRFGYEYEYGRLAKFLPFLFDDVRDGLWGNKRVIVETLIFVPLSGIHQYLGDNIRVYYIRESSADIARMIAAFHQAEHAAQQSQSARFPAYVEMSNGEVKVVY